ncbi:MAG: RagB/SusD family nutrient uptake outer membrane protein [Thalassobius sp.]|nr:RagB/SusD family nutrient uptake outer membrane protein [Thalassovita sp.]
MKNIYKYLLAATLTFSSQACEDSFLEISPEQSVQSSEAITDPNTLQTAMNGVYSLLQNSGYYGRSVYVIPELMADNLYLSVRNSGRYTDYNSFSVQEQDGYAEDLWNQAYEVIINATKAIQGGEALEGEQEELVDQLTGEAYAIRALAHFDLVRFFAQPYNYTADASHLGVPAISSIGDAPISPSRNTVSEVYSLIISDLENAIELMNEDTNDGTFSINAAKALLARVYLYTENWDGAISYATEVIESGNYQLVANEDYMNIWSEEYNSESIFEIVNTISDNASTNGLGHFFDPTGYADALATEDLVNIYDENDARLQTMTFGAKTGAEEEAYFIGKFPNGTQHDDNIRIFRLAEMYLIRAEAYARNANNTLAHADLNQIIQRASPDAEPVSLTGQELVDRILTERRKELAFEGHRLFDLNRNKKDVSIILSGSVIEASYPNDYFILPIPLSEINANPNIEPQNTGY